MWVRADCVLEKDKKVVIVSTKVQRVSTVFETASESHYRRSFKHRLTVRRGLSDSVCGGALGASPKGKEDR